MSDQQSFAQSPLVLLFGVVGTVVLLALLVSWALPLAILAIILMVMLHEFGHYITAKRAGLLVTDFFVGFGPVVWSTTRGETRYGIRALLLGGYVKVPGMTWSSEVPADEEPRTYRQASYPKKVLFASAGSLVHMVLALLLAWASFSFVGTYSSSHVGIGALASWPGHHQTAAQKAGLQAGDRVLFVNGLPVTSIAGLTKMIKASPGKTLSFIVERDGKDVTLSITPVAGQTLRQANGQPYATGTKPDGFIGVEIDDQIVHESLIGAVPSAFHEVGSTLADAYHGIIHVFSPAEFASLFHQVASSKAAEAKSNQDTRPASIVGVVRFATQAAQAGPTDLLLILMAVNVFIGVLNMLPTLPFDGGYVAIATYERLRSRRERHYHADVNKLTPVIYGVMSILLVLFVCTLYLDIAHPIANPFG